MFAPKDSLAGRVARCDDDDDWDECPPERSPWVTDALSIALGTLFMGGIAAIGEIIKDRGETQRERIRQMGRDRRARERREDEYRKELDAKLDRLAGDE